jgi:hypothetical protein
MEHDVSIISIIACVFVSAEPLPSNDKGIHVQTHKEQGGLISLLLFFQNRSPENKE